MKILKFDRERAREHYLSRYPQKRFKDKEIEMMLIRAELLARNELFIKEWRDLQKNKKIDDYMEREKALCKKWAVDEEGLPIPWPGPILFDWGAGLGFVVFKINLRYPKERIMKSLGKQIDKWLVRYQEDFKARTRDRSDGLKGSQDDNDEADLKEEVTVLRKVNEPSELFGYAASDLDECENYLEVWDLRNRKKSWLETAKEMGISVNTAHYWHKKAIQLIKQGLPGFPPFPPY